MADFRPFSPCWGDISFTEAPRTTARCYAGAIFLSCSPSGRHREPAGVEGAARRGAWPRRRWAAGPDRATHWHKPRPIGGRREAWGLAAVPVGDGRARAGNTQTPRPIGGRRGACGAWPDNESTRRAKLAARTASGRVGHAAAGDLSGQQATTTGRPPPTGTHSGPAHQGRPRGAWNTSGATSNTGNQAISGSQAPSGSPTWQQHPSARAGSRNRRQPTRGPRPRQ